MGVRPWLALFNHSSQFHLSSTFTNKLIKLWYLKIVLTVPLRCQYINLVPFPWLAYLSPTWTCGKGQCIFVWAVGVGRGQGSRAQASLGVNPVYHDLTDGSFQLSSISTAICRAKFVTRPCKLWKCYKKNVEHLFSTELDCFPNFRQHIQTYRRKSQETSQNPLSSFGWNTQIQVNGW